MSWDALEKIDPTKSTLGRLIYRRPGALARHLKRTLTEPYDAVVLYKFRGHLPSIADVTENLDFFAESIGWLAADTSDCPAPRVVRVLQRDWFMEVCAALGALGGVSALAGLLYQIRRDRQLQRQEPRTSVTAYPVPAGPRQVQMQRRVSRYMETVTTTSIGSFELQAVHEYYEEHLEFVEVYELPERVTRFYYRRLTEDEYEQSS